jgi:hypothetical protein
MGKKYMLKRLTLVEDDNFVSGYRIVAEDEKRSGYGIPASPYNIVLWGMYQEALARIQELEHELKEVQSILKSAAKNGG